jgi:hypothetical protein
MKNFWITLGAVAAAAGIAFYFKDNEKVKGTMDKINNKANNTLSKWSRSWREANDQFNKTVSGQA